MKQLTCEMCGSTDLVKQEGLFVCQSCGLKYSPEEAKKMMIEGTVDVQGTVKVDDSSKIDNFYTMAESAYDAGNNKEAESYCNRIIEIDPTHSEAWLLKGIAAAWQSTLANNRMEEFFTCLTNTCENAKSVESLNSSAERAYKEFYKLILAINKLKLDSVVNYPDNWSDYISFPVEYLSWNIQIQIVYGTAHNRFYEDKPEDERVKPNSLSTMLGLDDLDDKCKAQLVSSAITLWNNSLDDYNSGDGYPTDYVFERMINYGLTAMNMLDYAVPSDTSKISEEQKPNVIKACKNLVTMKSVWINLKSYTVSYSNGIESHPISKFVSLSAKQNATNDIRRYHDVIKLCDPDYEVPTVAEPTATTQKTGCYVATAVYGSYDCPQVWTLRRYRDYTLAGTWYGRAFIKTYYAISPTLVKWFGDTQWFRKMWKGKLDRMVADLQADGVESTPYEDRNW